MTNVEVDNTHTFREKEQPEAKKNRRNHLK